MNELFYCSCLLYVLILQGEAISTDGNTNQVPIKMGNCMKKKEDFSEIGGNAVYIPGISVEET
jgi:hypothetical protein